MGYPACESTLTHLDRYNRSPHNIWLDAELHQGLWRRELTINETEPAQELVKAELEQLMEHIRHQVDLCRSHTNYYLSIQAGLAIAHKPSV